MGDNRKRQEKDRRERQNQESQRTDDQSSGKRRDRQSQDRVRERQRTMSEQERRDTAGGFTKGQIKTKIKSLEKWKRKNGKLSEEDQKLLIQLNSLEKKQRVEEKSKRELEQSEHQRRMFEEAVKNAGADVFALGASKPVEMDKEAEQDNSVETPEKATNNKKKKAQKTLTQSQRNDNQSLQTELTFPKCEDAAEETSTKPSVQDSLNRIKERNEMKKKMSLDSLKSKKLGKESKRNSQQQEIKEKKKVLSEKAITSLSVQPEKKGKVKLRGKKKKATKGEEEEGERVKPEADSFDLKKKATKEKEEGERVESRVDSFDYNQLMPVEVEAGAVNYFAPLLLKKEKTADGKPTSSQAVKTCITDRKGRKSKKAEYLERNSHRFIKGDFQLMAFAQDYLHIKDCEEAESKFRRLNP